MDASAPQNTVSMRQRRALNGRNRLKLGLFGANCSSGRAVTLAPERWRGDWAENLRLAQMADDAGIDFMLPVARWKGFGGATDYQGATFETLTWASGLLAATSRLVVFGTVHAPLIPPVVAAKQCVTADHIGEGRFGLNVVCGWNEGEFDMFGVSQRDHESRYDYAQEWLDAVRLMWEGPDDADFNGNFLKLKAIRSKPKPYGGSRPLIMNAGASPTGQAFAVRNCDALFTVTRLGKFDETVQHVANIKAQAQAQSRDLDVYTVGVITCRPTAQEAQDYHRHCIVENADWGAVDNMLALHNITSETHTPEEFQRIRNHRANGAGGLPIIGDPDYVASQLAELSAAGLTGIAVSFINYGDELPYFCDEVLPRLRRLGLRD
jgi:dimethylsulfone monooxygenase